MAVHGRDEPQYTSVIKVKKVDASKKKEEILVNKRSTSKAMEVEVMK